MKKNMKWYKLGSKNVAAVLIVNAFIMYLICSLGIWLVNYNANTTDSLILGLDFKQLMLCIILSVIIDGAIDYFMIIVPIWNIQHMIEHYGKMYKLLGNTEDRNALSETSIENIIEFLIRQQELLNEKEHMEAKQRKKTELYALQTQINPHFLYNALDSIRGYALLHDMDEIAEITEALSMIFRNMISNRNELISLRKEFDNINSYMKIQQFRFNNKFHYSCEVEEEILDKYMVPRMVLQPLVENSIMHGLEKKIKDGWIKIKAYITDRRFILSVTDDGIGITEERLEQLNRIMTMPPGDLFEENSNEHTGVALININKRIKLNFGNQYGITLSSTPNIRTASEIVLPLIPNGK